MKRLIVNADDFGFTRGVNEGIIEAHRHGILTATTLMANGPAFEHAVQFAKANPTLDVGCHLVLVQGPGLPDGVPELLWRIARGKIDIYSEMKRQIEKILGADIVPTHLDTHKHTHLAPPVLKAVARLSKEFDIRWVRRPFGLTRKRGLRVLQASECRTTDHFAGFQLTGRLQTPELLRVISSLPDGLTEFMCHPGFYGDDLRNAPTRLKQSREEELRALTDPEVRRALQERGVELTNYRGLY